LAVSWDGCFDAIYSDDGNVVNIRSASGFAVFTHISDMNEFQGGSSFDGCPFEANLFPLGFFGRVGRVNGEH
jgi:hypothetical protein